MEMLGTDRLVNRLITHENEQRLKHVEEVARIGLVPCLERLCENLYHERKKVLEGFLTPELEGYKKGHTLALTMSALSSVSMYWAIVPRDLVTIQHAELVWQRRTAHLTVVTRTSVLSGSRRRVSKSLKKLCRCSWNPSTIVSKTVYRM